MSLELVTGKRGEAHVKSEDIGAFNAGIVSAGQYVLSTGSKFNYEIVTNNSIWIYDGEAIDQGRHMRIKPNDYEIVTIENGTQSQKRNDLIVLRYSKDTETGIESAEIKVIKGTSGSVPTDPPYITGNILTGDTTDDFPLYRVYLDGLNIESVEPLFHVLCSMEELKNNVSELNSALDSTASSLNTRFECGKVVIQGKSGEWSFVHVAYSHPHNNNPVVVASHASANVAQCACSIRLHNESGFDIGVYNTTAQTTFNWLAIEP
nr:MAG TPA: hypothetical protein [Caudoviricetes sp.]